MKRILTAVILTAITATFLFAARPALIKDEIPVVTKQGRLTFSAIDNPSQERLDQMVAANAAIVKKYIVYQVSATNPKVRFASRPVALTAEEILVQEGAGDIVEELK